MIVLIDLLTIKMATAGYLNKFNNKKQNDTKSIVSQQSSKKVISTIQLRVTQPSVKQKKIY